MAPLSASCNTNLDQGRVPLHNGRMAVLPTVFLDIETAWDNSITVIGLLDEETGVTQLYGGAVTADKLRAALPRRSRLLTFNGHAFDLKVIHGRLGVNLWDEHEHVDLMWECRKFGLKGGQKKIELLLGLGRDTAGVTGRDAPALWREYLDGSEEALALLLRYNEEDLRGMASIKRYLDTSGLVLPAPRPKRNPQGKRLQGRMF